MNKWIKLENFIYLIIILLPAYLVRLTLFSVPTNCLEILISGALIIRVWTGRKEISARSIFQKYQAYLLPLGLIMAGLVISTIMNHNYVAGLGIIKGWFVFPLALAIVAGETIPPAKRNNIFKALYISAVLVAAAGLGYYLLGKVRYDGRLEAFFNSPNYLAMYLATGILIGTAFFRENKKVFSITLMLLCVAFFLTFSYASWLALGASLVAVNFLKRGGRIFSDKKWLLAAVLLGVFIIFSQWHNQKFQDLKGLSERSSFSSRLMIWEASGRIATDNFFWGIGPGNFQAKYLEYQKYFPPYLEWAVPHPHSLYLAFWLYAGLPGLIGFLWLIGLWFKKNFASFKKTPVGALVFGIMLYILLHGLADTTYLKNDLAAVFWLTFFSLL